MTIGYPSDGIAPEEVRPKFLCNFYDTWKDAMEARIEFNPKHPLFTEPISDIYNRQMVNMNTSSAV